MFNIFSNSTSIFKRLVYEEDHLAFAFLFLQLDAQLANTKWKVTLALDNPIDVIFHFKKDTVTAFFAADTVLAKK